MSWKKCLSSERAAKRSKIRKRGCSSSSSSSFVGRCRFKRAFPAENPVGTSTPVPPWPVDNRSTSSKVTSSETAKMQGGKVKEQTVSTRKLGATLWETDEAPPQTVAADGNKMNRREKNSPTSQAPPDSFCNAVSEIQTHSRTNRKPTKGRKNRLKEVRNGLATAMELLKVLNHLQVPGKHNPSSSSLISELGTELSHLKHHVEELLKDQRSNQNKLEQLVRCFAEEKAWWVRKERDRMEKAVEFMAEEVQTEKKLRKQAERMGKKLGKELADSKASLITAIQEAEREKRAKEIFEQLCDELARGVGEDRARVQELKNESVKVREEVEKEREMLQLADGLREERVQMKLSEAKYHFEEKNAAIDKLKSELEACLKNSKSSQEKDPEFPKFEKIKELEAYLKEINFGSSPILDKNQNPRGVEDDGEDEEEDDDSADSDLHSIELNLENNDKSYKWSFAGEESDSKRNSEIKERKSFSEKIQWGSICFNRGASAGKNGDSGRKTPGTPTNLTARPKVKFRNTNP